jgi:DNA replication licensing factor MCM7
LITKIGAGADADPKQRIPPELERNYQIVLIPGEYSKKSVVKMRDIKSSCIGSLVTMKGIVVRASDVKPCVQVAVYTCQLCGFEVYQVINSKEFNPQIICPSEKCKTNNINGQLIL